MPKFVRLINKVLATSAAILMWTSITQAEPAHAAPEQEQVSSGWIYLTANPTDDMHTFCVAARPLVEGATYEWQIRVANQRFPGQYAGLTGRMIKLGTDDYDWNVCIDPKDSHYVLYSELDPVYPPWRTVRLTSRGFTVSDRVGLFSVLSILFLDN